MRKLSVLLACNETLPAEAIAEAFNSRGDIEVVGSSSNSENTIEMVRTLPSLWLLIQYYCYWTSRSPV